uniref:SJCHGC03291 protein n=1 Tax=Schistosoma japonicum TaxID=6182 RepID=Q5D8S6_SCHJA|nr:SJCHGC03291 protein [Schistosoma japonicum]
MYRLLLFITFLSQSLSVDYLKFEEIQAASKESLIFLNDVNPTTLLDASANHHRIVYFSIKNPVMELKLTFSCLVNKQENPLSKVSLCCRKSVDDAKRTCFHPRGEGTSSCLNTEFHFSVDEKTGANFSSSLTTSLSNPISGLFSCVVAADEFNVVESNEVEIRDAVFYIRQLKSEASNKVDVVSPIYEFPYELRCSDDTNIVSRWAILDAPTRW